MYRKKMAASVGLCIGLVGASEALAVDATLAVQGSITPAACNMVVGLTNGEIDFGNIPAGSLDPIRNTLLPLKYFPAEVNCSGPTQIAFRLADNRGSSKAASSNYGLGYSPKRLKIGGYNASIELIRGDGAELTRIVRLPGEDWRLTAAGAFNPRGDLVSGSADATTPIPYPFTHLQMELKIRASIAGSEGLTFEDEIPLDGSSVLEMVYL